MERLLGDRLHTIEARVPVSLEVRAGDVVTLGIDDSTLARSAVRVYLMPLGGLLAGSLSGHLLLPAASDAAVMSGALFGLLAGLAAVRMIGQSRNSVPVVVSGLAESSA